MLKDIFPPELALVRFIMRKTIPGQYLLSAQLQLRFFSNFCLPRYSQFPQNSTVRNACMCSQCVLYFSAVILHGMHLCILCRESAFNFLIQGPVQLQSSVVLIFTVELPHTAFLVLYNESWQSASLIRFCLISSENFKVILGFLFTEILTCGIKYKTLLRYYHST